MAKRISRHFLLQDPEEVLTWAQRLLAPLKRHAKWILLGVVGVAIIFGAWAINARIQAGKEEKAETALVQLNPKLTGAGANAETLKSLEALIRDYPGTKAAQEARLWRAHVLYQMKRYADAAKAYESLPLGREPGWDLLVAESLSYCYEAPGDLKKAAQVLKPATEKASGGFQSELWRHLAMLLEQAGDPKEAGVYWRKLLDQPSNPALVSYLKEKVAADEAASKK
jgi:Flp pilus assembly protein TadD